MKTINVVLGVLASYLVGTQIGLCQPASPGAASSYLPPGTEPRRSLAVNLGVDLSQNLATNCAVSYGQNLSTNLALSLAQDLSTNLAVNFCLNLATNFAVNFGQDLSTPTLDYFFPLPAVGLDWSKMFLPEAEPVENQ